MTLARSALLALAAIPIVSNASGAADQRVSATGRWHVDFARSSTPGGRHPESVTLDIVTDDERTYEATETVVENDGKIRTERIKAQYDGSPYPVEGSPDQITISMTRLANGSKYIKLDTPLGFRAATLCSLSDDFNVMTCDADLTDPQGRITPARSVYVRDTPGQPSR
jgi:hypothetical protein